MRSISYILLFREYVRTSQILLFLHVDQHFEIKNLFRFSKSFKEFLVLFPVFVALTVAIDKNLKIINLATWNRDPRLRKIWYKMNVTTDSEVITMFIFV